MGGYVVRSHWVASDAKRGILRSAQDDSDMRECATHGDCHADARKHPPLRRTPTAKQRRTTGRAHMPTGFCPLSGYPNRRGTKRLELSLTGPVESRKPMPAASPSMTQLPTTA